MPLILAIEPDRRQAAQLSHIAKHRVHADLVLADTTERALDVIGDRVPDLILVPALLSPQDDAALAAALRVIAAASNVRTLTIPVFASGVKQTGGARGLLGRWRRGKSEQATDGCDPALFADQIAEYLKSVAAERTWEQAEGAIAAPKMARNATEPAVEWAVPALETPVETFSDTRVEAVTETPVEPAGEVLVETAFEMSVHAAPEVPAEAAPEMSVEAAPEMLVEAAVEMPVEAAAVEVPAEAAEMPLEAAVEMPLEAAVQAPFEAPFEAAVEAPVEEAVDAFAEAPTSPDDVPESAVDMALATLEDGEFEIDLSDDAFSDTDEPDADVEEEPSVFELNLEDAGAILFDEPIFEAPPAFAAPPTVLAETLTAIDHAAAPLSYSTPSEPETRFPDIFGFDDFVVETVRRPPIEHHVPMSCGLERQWPPMYGALSGFARALVEMDAMADVPAPAAAHVPEKPEHTEWSALIASLRQDIERLHKAGSTATKPTPPPERKVVPAPPVRQATKKPQRPPQDEWGFFDPAQCGFAALLAKLDEITEPGDDPETRRVN